MALRKTQSKSFYLGLLAGTASGALWGLSFLVPVVLPGYKATQVAFGRFFFFGLFSLLYFAFNLKKLTPHLNLKTISIALLLGLSGYSLYYFLLVKSIQFIGIAVSSLIIGLLPITIALFSRDKVYHRTLFYASLLAIFLGVCTLNFDLFSTFSTEATPMDSMILGLVLVTLSLVLWTWFAVKNSAFLKSNSNFKGQSWAAVLGISTLFTMFLICLAVHTTGDMVFSSSLLEAKYLFWSCVLGLGSTWFATTLWNYASHHVPVGLVGQLIVSETIFALLYGYIYEMRLPRLFEIIAILLLLGGVWMGIKAFQEPAEKING